MDPIRRKDGSLFYHSCTIHRVVKINTMKGMSRVVASWRWEIKPCGTPLFQDLEHATGVCNSCRKGWQVRGNEFASSTELDRARATAAVPAVRPEGGRS